MYIKQQLMLAVIFMLASVRVCAMDERPSKRRMGPGRQVVPTQASEQLIANDPLSVVLVLLLQQQGQIN